MAYPRVPLDAFIDQGIQKVILWVNGTKITESAIKSGSFSMDRYSSSSIALELGNVTSAQLTFTIDTNVSDISINRGDVIQGQIYTQDGTSYLTDVSSNHLTTRNGDNLIANNVTASMDLGKFYVTKLRRAYNSIEVTCLDSMIKLDTLADLSRVRFPITAKNILNQLFKERLGYSVVVDSGVYNCTLNEPIYGERKTYRQILSYICECMGANAYFDWDNNLHVGWYSKNSQIAVGTNRRTTSSKTESYFEITQVEIVDYVDANVELDGNSIKLRISANPFLETKTREEKTEIAQRILTNVGGTRYYGGTATILPMPGLYPMDAVSFEPGLVPLTHVTWGLNTNTKISGDISSDENNYNFGLADSITEAQNTADEGKELAENAKESADLAQASADQAQQTADEAVGKADTAQADATEALSRAAVYYGASTTSQSARAKVITCPECTDLKVGDQITVRFQNANTASSPTMNVNGTGAYPITAYGEPLNANSPYTWDEMAVVSFTFDGEAWTISDTTSLKKLNELDSDLNAEGVFNRLTDNGTVQGIIRDGDQLYINGEYIQANTLRGNKLYGGVIRGLNGNLVIDLDNDTILYENFATQDEIADLQRQITGGQTSYSGNYVPTASNAPADSWTTTADKDAHIGNVFYDTNTGYAYRWIKDGNVYKWQKISDSDVTEALAKANQALDEIDNIEANSYIDFQTPFTWNNAKTIATFTAKVYRLGVDITNTYPSSWFRWWLRNEDNPQELFLNHGKTCEVNVNDLGYGSTIIGEFEEYEPVYITDVSGNQLTTNNGSKLFIYEAI